MKRKSIINTYQNGGSKEVKYGTPEYKEAYDQNKLASVNPYTGQLQGKDLPEFEVEGKRTSMTESGRKAIEAFFGIPAATLSNTFGVPQAVMTEGIEAMRGNPYDFKKSLDVYPGNKPSSGNVFDTKQRVPSETIGFKNPEGFWQHAGNFALDSAADPANLLGMGNTPRTIGKHLLSEATMGLSEAPSLIKQGAKAFADSPSGQKLAGQLERKFARHVVDPDAGTAMAQLASHGKPRTTPGSLSFNTSLGDKARQLLGDEFNAMQKYTASGLSTEDALDLASKEVMKSGKYTSEEALKIAAMGLEDASKGRSGPFDKFNLLESRNLSLKGVDKSSKVGGGLLSKDNTLRGNIEDNSLLGSYQGRNQFGVFGDKAPDLIGDVSKHPAVKMMMENPEKYKESLNAASGTYLKKKLERGANYFQKYEKGKPYTGLDAFQDISPYAKGGKKKSILNCM